MISSLPRTLPQFRSGIVHFLAISSSALDIESLEVFENIAYIMAKHADLENVPDNPDEWLEAFNTFSIYEVLPQLIELWGLNVETQAESKKNIEKLTAR